ncbi:hypothetical protein U1Q18_019453 [Sarracenia purpurea var. burkii]
MFPKIQKKPVAISRAVTVPPREESKDRILRAGRRRAPPTSPPRPTISTVTVDPELGALICGELPCGKYLVGGVSSLALGLFVARRATSGFLGKSKAA